MISVGKNVRQVNDQLIQISIERMYNGLINPKSDLAKQLSFLRALQGIDLAQYKVQKLTLPYVVCAQFHPSIRKKENFLQTHYFILDLDHLHQFNKTVEGLKEELSKDEYIMLLFASPSNDGLKVIFQLETPIVDSMYYTVFYKIFAGQFAKKYGLEGVIDLKTNDVSRCCFMSFDSTAYYNPKASFVNAGDFTQDEDCNALDSLFKEIKEAEKKHKEAFETFEIRGTVDARKELQQDVLNEIKKRINPSLRIAAIGKLHFQPEEIEEVLKKLQLFLEDNTISIISALPISYGKQIRLKAGVYWAEINLFYGKKGYSVVKTTKTGSSTVLADLCHTLICQFLYN
jgi:hypothetical protein